MDRTQRSWLANHADSAILVILGSSSLLTLQRFQCDDGKPAHLLAGADSSRAGRLEIQATCKRLPFPRKRESGTWTLYRTQWAHNHPPRRSITTREQQSYPSLCYPDFESAKRVLKLEAVFWKGATRRRFPRARHVAPTVSGLVWPQSKGYSQESFDAASAAPRSMKQRPEGRGSQPGVGC